MPFWRARYRAAPCRWSRDGKPRSGLLRIEEYAALIQRLEELTDLQDARAVIARIDSGEASTIPWETLSPRTSG